MPISPIGLQHDSSWIASARSFATNGTFNDNEGVYYNIDYAPGFQIFDDGSSGNTLGHTSAEAAFIRSVFDRLDPLIDLDFFEKSDQQGTIYDIYCVSDKSNWGATTVGSSAMRGGWFEIFWKDTGAPGLDSDYDKNTIVHEIGHALGLSHPFGDGFNPDYDMADTVMSYRSSLFMGGPVY